LYPPPHHQSDDIKKIIQVIKAYPLAALISTDRENPFITHIPIIYNDETGNLVAHIDRSNPQTETLTNGAKVTTVFRGPDTYISPSIYSTKQLPTWNYIIVHVTGTIKLITDPEAAKDTMIAMTKFLEGTPQKYVLAKENPSMDRLVQYIQAFEITVTKWEGKFKLSQDKNPTDYKSAKEELLNNTSADKKAIITTFFDS